MEIGSWISLAVGVIIPFVVWIFNSIITNKINELYEQQKADRELFLRKLDFDRAIVEKDYVLIIAKNTPDMLLFKCLSSIRSGVAGWPRLYKNMQQF